MAQGMRHDPVTPSPSATVVYIPETQVLYLENGRIREAAEEMAWRIVVYYSKEDETEAVAVRIDSAETVLSPFVDSVLLKNGITPDPDSPGRQHKKGYREVVITKVRHEEFELAPYSEATYDPDRQTLLIENGEPGETCQQIAKDIHIYCDGDFSPTSAVAIRIDHAETVLKPFVDAVLAKYGINAEATSLPTTNNEADD